MSQPAPINQLDIAADAPANQNNQSYEQAYNLLTHQKKEEAFRSFKELAEAGHLDAMHMLGNLYSLGMGCQMDLQQAFFWIKAAATRGNVGAFNSYALFYKDGRVVDQDFDEALKWIKRGVEENEPYALYNMGIFYEFGYAVKPNTEEALKYYILASQQHVDVRYKVGRLLESHPELQQKYGEKLPSAFEWFKAAEEFGKNNDDDILPYLYRKVKKIPDACPEHGQECADNALQRSLILLSSIAKNKKINYFFPNGLGKGDFHNGVITDTDIDKLFGKERTPEELRALVEEWKKKPEEITSEKLAQIERTYEFYRLIHAPEAKVAYAAYMLAKAQIQHGQSFKQIKASAADIGPRYNKLSKEGYPLPGALDDTLPKRQGFFCVRNMGIKDGVPYVTGPQTDNPLVANIFPEDIQVALILAFVESDKGPVRPKFSLEQSLKKKHRNPRVDRFDRKVFTPEWLADTDFGKTLYWTDYLMKQMGGNMGNAFASLTDPLYALDYNPEMHEQILPEVIRRLDTNSKKDDDSGKPDDQVGARLMLSLGSVEMEQRGSQLTVGSAKMFIESSGIRLLANGEEDRSFRPNDPTTKVGYNARQLTNSYADVEEAFPAFGRLKHLLVLYRGFEQLRLKGYTLAPQVMQELQKVRDNYRYPSGIQLVPKPFHRNGCMCHGGVAVGEAKIEPLSEEYKAATEDRRFKEDLIGQAIIEGNEYVKDRELSPDRWEEGIKSSIRTIGNAMGIPYFKKEDPVYPMDYGVVAALTVVAGVKTFDCAVRKIEGVYGSDPNDPYIKEMNRREEVANRMSSVSESNLQSVYSEELQTRIAIAKSTRRK